MATYVLVHGAWAGAWVWRSLRPLLAAKGHEVFSPSLTGQSERFHNGGPQTNLTTHILDVERLIRFEELSGIVLVGHSYGGMVVTGVANVIPERIKHLVYLDAFVPKDGESVDSISPSRERVVEDGWRVMPAARPVGGDASPLQRIFGHPLGTLTEAVHLSKPLEEYSFTRTYIKATEPPRAEGGNAAFWSALDHAHADPAWQAFELPTTHNAQLTMPKELAEILLNLT